MIWNASVASADHERHDASRGGLMLEDRQRQRALLVAVAEMVEVRRTLVEQSLAFALMDERVPRDAQIIHARFRIMRNDANIPHACRDSLSER